MVQVTTHSAEDVARIAAEAVTWYPDMPLKTVRAGIDSLGERAYFLTYAVGADLDPKTVAARLTEISVIVRDQLVLLGDEAYPYVWLGQARQRVKK